MNIRRNPKCFWNMVRDKTQVRQGVSDLNKTEGDTVTDDIEKANLLNSFFASAFTQENISNIPRMPARKVYNILNEVSINEDKVKEILASLKIDKSPGPDGIHNRVLYENREQILVPLTETLINSFETGKIPEDWKLAKVIPIFKKGKKSDPNNYRPISLTSTVSKIMETIIRDKIAEHLEELDLTMQRCLCEEAGNYCL